MPMDAMDTMGDDGLSPQEKQIAAMADRLLANGTPLETVRALVKRQMESISGRLAKKNRRLNQNEQDALNAEDTSPGGFGSRFGGIVAAGMGTLPGGEPLVTGVHALTSGQSYGDAYKDVQQAMQEQGRGMLGVDAGVGRGIARAAGIAAQAAYLNPEMLAQIPGIGAKAAAAMTAANTSRAAGAGVGGTIAGVQRFTDANPNEDIVSRLRGTVGATALGAGTGYAMPWLMGGSKLATGARTLAGAGLGAYGGAELAPQGYGTQGAVAGALAGGTTAYNPGLLVGALSKFANKIPSVEQLLAKNPQLQQIAAKMGRFAPTTGTTAQTLQDVGNAVGQSGAALRELAGRQEMRVGGSILGDTEAGAGAILGKRAEQGATGQALYEKALDKEARLSHQRYAEHRGAIEDANAARMMEFINPEQETVQSAAGAPAPVDPNEPIGVTIQRFKQMMADAATGAERQAGPASTSAGLPQTANSSEKLRLAEQNALREGPGYLPSEFGRVAGTGTPEFIDTGMPTTATTRAPASSFPQTPYRPESVRAGIGEMQDASAAAARPDMVTTQTPSGQVPQLQYPEQQALNLRTAPEVTPRPLVPPRNETYAQQTAREALEKRSAYEGLPSSPPEAPRPMGPIQLEPVPKLFPGVEEALSNPIAADAAAELRKLPQWKNAAPDDPRFLSAVYQGLSDQSVGLQQGIGRAAGLTSVNMPRQTLEAVKDAQAGLIKVFDEMMPSYDIARTEHAKAASWMAAYRKGHAAMGAGEATGRDLGRKGIAALESEAQKLAEKYGSSADDAIAAMRKGAMDRLNDIQSEVPLTAGRAGVLARRPFTSAEADMPRLQFALGNEGANAYSQMLARQTANVAQGGNYSRLYLPGSVGRMISGAVNDAAFVPALQTKTGTDYIAALLQKPNEFQDVLASYGRGATTTKTAQQILAGLLGKSVSDNMPRF